MVNQNKEEDRKISYWLEKLHIQRNNASSSSSGSADKKVQDTGKKDAMHSINKERNISAKNMSDLVKKSNIVLNSISTHKFPFDFFPSGINVEETRVTIITRSFASSQVHSIDVKDISNVFISFAPFFAQLTIISSTFADNNITINNLKKKEAVYTRRIVEGLRVLESNNINTSEYTSEQLMEKLEDLSTTEIVR